MGYFLLISCDHPGLWPSMRLTACQVLQVTRSKTAAIRQFGSKLHTAEVVGWIVRQHVIEPFSCEGSSCFKLCWALRLAMVNCMEHCMWLSQYSMLDCGEQARGFAKDGNESQDQHNNRPTWSTTSNQYPALVELLLLHLLPDKQDQHSWSVSAASSTSHRSKWLSSTTSGEVFKIRHHAQVPSSSNIIKQAVQLKLAGLVRPDEGCAAMNTRSLIAYVLDTNTPPRIS